MFARISAVNLSCGNCKRIQPFSGEPLKCDACGWVTGTPSQSKESRPYKPKNTLGERLQDAFVAFVKFVLTATILVLVVYYGILWLEPEKQRLADEYHVSQDAVFIGLKPHGCDFDDAPLGNKHCHYEKVIDTDKACSQPDCRVRGVYVSWRKVEE